MNLFLTAVLTTSLLGFQEKPVQKVTLPPGVQFGRNIANINAEADFRKMVRGLAQQGRYREAIQELKGSRFHRSYSVELFYLYLEIGDKVHADEILKTNRLGDLRREIFQMAFAKEAVRSSALPPTLRSRNADDRAMTLAALSVEAAEHCSFKLSDTILRRMEELNVEQVFIEDLKPKLLKLKDEQKEAIRKYRAQNQP